MRFYDPNRDFDNHGLIYLIVTRSDISHAMGMVSKSMDAPHSVHYADVLQILRYVKGTLYHGLHYFS